jgi:hypothetical protein
MLQHAHCARDEKDDDSQGDADLDHGQNLRPSRQQRRVSRTKGRALRKRNKKVIDEMRPPATAFEPTASMIEAEGKGYILASVGEESGEIPYTAYFAKKSYIEDNSKLIQKFVNALYKAQKWVDEHTAKEVAEVIAGRGVR